MKAIIHTKLVMEDGIIWDGALTYDQDKIIQVGWARDVEIPPARRCSMPRASTRRPASSTSTTTAAATGCSPRIPPTAANTF